MKKAISILVTLALTASLAACGGKTQPTDKNTESPTTTTTETPSTEPTKKEKAVLTSLMEMNDGWVRNFNPFISSAYQFVQGFMYEPLVVFDSYNNNKEHMWLAEDIITEPDYKTLTVKVRKGVKWSDGKDLTAKDVAFSFTYSKDHPEIDRNGDWGENGKIKSVEIVDDYTVKIVMREVNRFHRNTVFFQKWIVPEHIFSSISDPATYVLENPVVTGAFSEVVSFEPEMVVLGRNPNYWQGDKLQVDELRVPQYNGNDAGLVLLQSGEVDWAHLFIPDAETNYVQGDPHRKFWYGVNDGVRLAFNYMTPNKDNLKAFNNVDFKRAVSLAVDRETIIDSAVYGYLSRVVPTNTGLPPALWGYRDAEADEEMAKYTKFDIEQAKQILANAGFKDVDGDGFVENPDGTKISFDIISPAGWTDWNDGAAIAAQGLQKAGINARAKAIDLSLVIETWATGNHDVLYGGYGTSADIWKFYFDTIGDQSRVKTSTWWSICQTNYVNDELSALIAKMPSASDAELKEITSKIEQFFAKNMINIPILYNGNWFVYNDSRFTGWATEDNPMFNPANCNHDSKLLQLMNLQPVQK
ncbi:ABC transporter substrate-binding protein [Clostridium thermarum]|uniref:ABC transporter substrate-binding protein n=1 Tax=Clostridium thermarum TaxID=1716543 RepID=UPI0013D6B25D|nr:ABC transporter substrate-binding protein [Clostridium thermarum]